jgi:hypothetical protein
MDWKLKNKMPISLNDQVRWPTPKAQNANGAGIHGRGGMDLQTAVSRWPTPTSRDHKDTGDMTNVPVNSLLGRAVEPTKTNGSLDPAFVEYLMGYHFEWSVLKDWAIAWFRPARGKRLKG